MGKNRRGIQGIAKEKRDENLNSNMLEGAKSIGAGAATIASAGAAVGIGNVLSSSIHSVARNPSLAKQSFGYAILGFALTEAIASFAPMMASLISSVFQSRKGVDFHIAPLSHHISKKEAGYSPKMPRP